MMWIIFLIGCYLYVEILHFIDMEEFFIYTLPDISLEMTIGELFGFVISVLLLVCISPVWYLWITYRWIRSGK